MKYRPVNVLPADWNRVKDFCRQAVLTYEPANAKIAAEMLSTVTLFVLWATIEEHAPLDYASIFHPTLMGRYLRSRVSNKNSSAYKSLHSRLFRIAKAVADVDHNRRKRGRFAVPVHEYSARELAELESWAGAHHTAQRRHQARTVLALMGGAGLWTKEALAVRGADILTGTDGYSIRVSGRNARVVPLLSDFAAYLGTTLERSDESRFVLFPDGANEESRAGSLKLLYRGEHPAPNAQWLRDTWMLRQLRALPASIVMKAAGMPDVTTLRRYLPNASLPYEGWESALRNPAACMKAMDRTGDDINVSVDRRAAHGKPRCEVATANTKSHNHAQDSDTQVAAASGHAGRCGLTSALHAQTSTTRSTAIPARTHAVPSRHVELSLAADSTSFPAGVPVLPFKRVVSVEELGGGAGWPNNGDGSEPHVVEAPKADWSQMRPRNRSRYEALPPSVATLPAALEDRAAAADPTAEAVTEFEALREALLADARRSARGGKR